MWIHYIALDYQACFRAYLNCRSLSSSQKSAIPIVVKGTKQELDPIVDALLWSSKASTPVFRSLPAELLIDGQFENAMVLKEYKTPYDANRASDSFVMFFSEFYIPDEARHLRLTVGHLSGRLRRPNLTVFVNDNVPYHSLSCRCRRPLP